DTNSMIEITCAGCGKRLLAKPEWVGRTAKCPRCGQSIRIEPAAAEPAAPSDALPLDDVPPGERVVPATEEHVTTFRPPERLNRQHDYLICDPTSLVATWANNGDGWMLKTSTGYLPARRNRDKLPQQGDFRLVELRIAIASEGKRLTGLASYQLAKHWALTVLDQGDDLVLEKITGPAGLNRDQKNVVRQAIRDRYMRPVWQDATAVLDYLGNVDQHTAEIG
ncbi:MAG: hypothetical protein ABFC96_13610, partial [Thermoguttaceae bacterium]